MEQVEATATSGSAYPLTCNFGKTCYAKRKPQPLFPFSKIVVGAHSVHTHKTTSPISDARTTRATHTNAKNDGSNLKARTKRLTGTIAEIAHWQIDALA